MVSKFLGASARGPLLVVAILIPAIAITTLSGCSQFFAAVHGGVRGSYGVAVGVPLDEQIGGGVGGRVRGSNLRGSLFGYYISGEDLGIGVSPITVAALDASGTPGVYVGGVVWQTAKLGVATIAGYEDETDAQVWMVYRIRSKKGFNQ